MPRSSKSPNYKAFRDSAKLETQNTFKFGKNKKYKKNKLLEDLKCDRPLHVYKSESDSLNVPKSKNYPTNKIKSEDDDQVIKSGRVDSFIVSFKEKLKIQSAEAEKRNYAYRKPNEAKNDAESVGDNYNK